MPSDWPHPAPAGAVMDARHRGPRTLAEIAGPTMRKCCAEFGFRDIQIFRDWQWIAGSEIASRCTPVKISGAGGKGERVLHIRTSGGHATAVAHCSAAIIERISTACGYRAVDRIRVVQTGRLIPVAARPDPAPPRIPTPQDRAAVSLQVAGVRDPALRDALLRLGIAIRADDRYRRTEQRGRNTE